MQFPSQNNRAGGRLSSHWLIAVKKGQGVKQLLTKRLQTSARYAFHNISSFFCSFYTWGSKFLDATGLKQTRFQICYLNESETFIKTVGGVKFEIVADFS